jgi:hypothetical protein
MDGSTYVPVIVEATRFVFSEVGKWIDHARRLSGQAPANPPGSIPAQKANGLSQPDFDALRASLPNLTAAINAQVAQTNAYVIEKLVAQIQTHHRSLADLETAEAEYGPLTPQHIKRGIEHEATAIVEKAARLRGLLEQVYGKRIESS